MLRAWRALLVATPVDDVVAVWARKFTKLLRPSQRCSAKVTVDIGHLGRWNDSGATSVTTMARTFSGDARFFTPKALAMRELRARSAGRSSWCEVDQVEESRRTRHESELTIA
jgi:hypothetical protein